MEMELICQRNNKKMQSETAHCEHGSDYCKFRTSCMINFISQERDREERKGDVGRAEENGAAR